RTLCHPSIDGGAQCPGAARPGKARAWLLFLRCWEKACGTGGSEMSSNAERWPELPYGAWKDTCATLQLWTQIVGKIRLVQTPWLNHSWHVVFYVTPRGLSTSSIPYGERSFELNFDLLEHVLHISTSDGQRRKLGLYPRSVADFYAAVMRGLAELGL